MDTSVDNHTYENCFGDFAIYILLVGSAFAMSACGTSAWQLRSETEIAHLAGRKIAGDAVPSQMSRVLVAHASTNDGTGTVPVYMAVERKSLQPSDRATVFVHGLFGNRSVWRFITGDLAQDGDLYLVDLPGCGESSKPDPAVVGEGFYSPRSLARCVWTAISKLRDGPDAPARITLVGHALGGMVVLRMLADPTLGKRFAAVRARVDRAVLLAPADVAVEKKYPTFEAIAKLTDFEATIGDALGILDAKIYKSVYEAAADPSRCPRELAELGVETLGTAATRHAAQAMIRQAVPFKTNERPDWERIAALEADYANIDVPCLLLWGRQDETLPLSMGYKLCAQLPRAYLRIVPSCTHLVQFDAPGLTVELIRRFTQTGGKDAPRVHHCDERAPATKEIATAAAPGA